MGTHEGGINAAAVCERAQCLGFPPPPAARDDATLLDREGPTESTDPREGLQSDLSCASSAQNFNTHVYKMCNPAKYNSPQQPSAARRPMSAGAKINSDGEDSTADQE